MPPAVGVGLAIVGAAAMIVILALLVGDGSNSVESEKQDSRSNLLWPEDL